MILYARVSTYVDRYLTYDTLYLTYLPTYYDTTPSLFKSSSGTDSREYFSVSDDSLRVFGNYC